MSSLFSGVNQPKKVLCVCYGAGTELQFHEEPAGFQTVLIGVLLTLGRVSQSALMQTTILLIAVVRPDQP